MGAQRDPWNPSVKGHGQVLLCFCCFFGECIFMLAEQEASNTPLTTQVDPQESSNQRYANFPNSNFAASLRLSVWYNAIIWLCWWQLGCSWWLGGHRDSCLILLIWLLSGLCLQGEQGALLSHYSIRNNFSKFFLKFAWLSFQWQQLVLADRIESAKRKIQQFEVCLLSANPPAALAFLPF